MTPTELTQVEATNVVEPWLIKEARNYHQTKIRNEYFRRFDPRTKPINQGNNKTSMFDFLINYPQFANLKQIVKQDPKLLDLVIADLLKTNPSLGTFINSNKQEFLLLFQ